MLLKRFRLVTVSAISLKEVQWDTVSVISLKVVVSAISPNQAQWDSVLAISLKVVVLLD